MGLGKYSATSRAVRADSLGYGTKSAREIFKERNMNSAMNPAGVDIRESRDSDEHPLSLSIVLGLDVTGSMGSIPHYLIKEGLPNIMASIIESGVKHPQLMFLGIGDHECDKAPLQVGQFESSDALLDHWLTSVYIEGGGGGNFGESYLLAWYFAAFHTSIDCLEKRNSKGFLFTIGDEPCLKGIKKYHLERIMGPKNEFNKDYTAMELLKKAREKYNVYHLHLEQGSNGMVESVIRSWDEMGEDFIRIKNKKDVVNKIVEIVTTQATKDDFIKTEDIDLDL
jgi:hypothetical protein